ncbi:hypothetical protein MJT46_007558 [Ovis ammon polii x Ovis aries]|nr:hypothetical protein MJT46_007558 [Ovis ammon polii x Ovis aries]
MELRSWMEEEEGSCLQQSPSKAAGAVHLKCDFSKNKTIQSQQYVPYTCNAEALIIFCTLTWGSNGNKLTVQYSHPEANGDNLLIRLTVLKRESCDVWHCVDRQEVTQLMRCALLFPVALAVSCWLQLRVPRPVTGKLKVRVLAA